MRGEAASEDGDTQGRGQEVGDAPASLSGMWTVDWETAAQRASTSEQDEERSRYCSVSASSKISYTDTYSKDPIPPPFKHLAAYPVIPLHILTLPRIRKHKESRQPKQIPPPLHLETPLRRRHLHLPRCQVIVQIPPPSPSTPRVSQLITTAKKGPETTQPKKQALRAIPTSRR